jgi:hypothetical protein
MDFDQVVAAAQTLPTRTDVERGLKGLTIGVLHSLRRSRELGFTTRAGAAVGPDYSSELDAAGLALLSGQPMPSEWLAGFYFNSALVRIAAGSHRALRVVFATGQGGFWSLSERAVRERKVAESEINLLRGVDEDVNGFKHDGKAVLLRSRKIETIEQSVDAAGQLVGLIQKAV